MNDNASCFQYGCEPSPPPMMPYTGLDVGVIGCVGLLIVAIGLVIRNRLDRRS